MTKIKGVDTDGLEALDEMESHLLMSRMIRGAIIASFSEVEFLVTDLIARCLLHPQYRDLVMGKVPYPLDKRLRLVRHLFVAPGMLHKSSLQALPLLERLSEFEDLRHMMAHGLLTVREEDMSIRFIRYDHEKNNVLYMKRMIFTLDSFSERHRDIGRYSLAVAELFHEIFQTMPPAQFGELSSEIY